MTNTQIGPMGLFGLAGLARLSRVAFLSSLLAGVAAMQAVAADDLHFSENFDGMKGWSLIHHKDADAKGTIVQSEEGLGVQIDVEGSAPNQWIALHKAVALSFKQPYVVEVKLRGSGAVFDLQFALQGTNKIRYAGLKRGIVGGGHWQTVRFTSDQISKSWMEKGPAYPDAFGRVHLILKTTGAGKGTVIVDDLRIRPVDLTPPAFRFAKIFSDHGVLQANKPLTVWGFAKPDASIAVALAAHSLQAKADASGQWQVTFPAMSYGGPYELNARSGDAEISCRDLMVGEVWLGSGQSNMAWAVGMTDSAAEDYQRKSNPKIRLFLSEPVKTTMPQDDLQPMTTGWKMAGPQSIGDFSSLGYQFARFLQAERNVTVGFIQAAKGGSAIESWLDPDTAKRLEAQRASGFYHAMIHPIKRYSLRGILWYQGESNTRDPAPYADRFKGLIKGWRTAFDAPLPFVYVQLANFTPKRESDRGNWPILRNAQADALRLPKTAMATAVDLGDPSDIHPRDKRELARRMLAGANAIAYGRHPNWSSGPCLISAKFDGDAVTLQLTKPLAKTERVSGIELSADGEVFHPATINLRDAVVVARAAEVPEPRFVRHAWADAPTIHLRDRDGYPLIPFRASKP